MLRIIIYLSAAFALLFIANGDTSQDNTSHNTLQSLQRYIKETPNDPELYLHQGYIYHQLTYKEIINNDDVTSYSNSAELSYKKCLTLNPTNVNCMVNLGKILYDRFQRQGLLDSNATNQQMLVDIFHRAMEISPPDHLQSRVNLGINLHNMKRYSLAVEVYKEALPFHDQSLDLLFNYALSLTEIGDISEAMKFYHAAVDIDPTYIKAWLNMGTLHHKHGLLADAVWNYHHAIKVLLLHFFSAEELTSVTDYTIHCPFDMVYHLLDKTYKKGLTANCDYKNHIFIQLFNKANSDDAIRLLVIILNNLGQAMLQQGRVHDSIQHHFSAATIIHTLILKKQDALQCEENEKVNTMNTATENIRLWNLFLEACVLIFKSAKASCEWSLWNMIDILVQKINEFQFRNGLESSLLPFDTLSLPVSPMWKKKVAIRHALQFSSTNNNEVFPDLSIYDNTNKIRIGFLSYDFKNHPTSHLTEGIFYWYNQSSSPSSSSNLEIAVYSYGIDDNSTYRNNIKNLVGGCYLKDGGDFFDISSLSHHSAIDLIRKDKPHVVYDMQGFTLGGRNELTAYRIAPIQVSYLVFPGTSGAMYIDYIVGDKFVTPPEHMDLYTEKFAIMSRSYQVNHYERHLNKILQEHSNRENSKNTLPKKTTLTQFQEWLHTIHRGGKHWKDLRINDGLPSSPNIFVFANFNKQDKLEPDIFRIWMQIMLTVPNSILWLLEPVYLYSKKDIEMNILAMAEAEGVERNRIIFAKRVDKVQHLQRGIIADLFLDSIYYGAHSTATDALIGGLPVLTISGNSFSSRVAVSLLNSVSAKIATLLVSYTIKEYTDMAVYLATTKTALGNYLVTDIKFELHKTISDCDLFDSEGYVEDFEYMSKALWEIRSQGGNSLHLIM